MPSTEVARPVEHDTRVFDMPSGLWQAQCACTWKGEETTQAIAERQAGDHLLKPDGFSAQTVAAIEHYGKDEAERATKRAFSRQVNPTDTAVMKLRSAGYARYEEDDKTAAAILYREAAIQIAQELQALGDGYTSVEAATLTPMIVERTVVKEVKQLPPPPKSGIRGLIQRAARAIDGAL